MTGIKACEEPPDNGGERTALKTENDSPQETEEPLRSLCLGYSGEMESCSFVRQEQGSAVKGRTGGQPARERGHLPSGCAPHAGAGLRSGAGRLGLPLGSLRSTAPFHHGQFQSFLSQLTPHGQGSSGDMRVMELL